MNERINLDQETLDVMTKVLKRFNGQRQLYKDYDDYYEGRHRLRFATDKFTNAFGRLFRKFASNMMPTIVEAAADRIQISGWQSANQDVTLADDIWLRNNMDNKAGDVHEEALKMGDAYVIVWPDKDGFPVIYPQEAMSIVVIYNEDSPNIIDVAAKLWPLENEQWRLTLYYSDRIEKYRTISKVHGLPDKPSAFTPYLTPGESWPLFHTYERVNVFHWPNKSGLKLFGRSELKDVIPVQDALNKTIMDMLVAMEYGAYPQRWATGIEEPDIDPETGKAIQPFKAAMDRLWQTENSEANFGQFQATDLEQFESVQNGFRLDIARITKTPLHYFLEGADGFPSGEALKTAEAPFVAKVKDRQHTFGDVWEDVMHFCLQILDSDIDKLDIVWESASPRSEREVVEIAIMKKSAGVPQEIIWKELGYDDEQIKEMLTMKAKDDVETANNFLDSMAR